MIMQELNSSKDKKKGLIYYKLYFPPQITKLLVVRMLTFGYQSKLHGKNDGLRNVYGNIISNG